MKYERELARIKNYIKEFDPCEFSSSKEFVESTVDEEFQKKCAEKFKARILRRRQMEEKLNNGLFFDGYDASDVVITQKQIDELLKKL